MHTTAGKAFFAALASAALLGATASPAAADVSFQGTTMKIVIPFGPGGTYDKYGQAFAKHLDRFLPGHPTIILQYMPGAGGVKAMNWAYSAMPRDGLNMIVPLDNAVVNQLMRPEKMRFDSRKFTWLGASNQTNIVLVVRADTGIRTFDDMRRSALIGGSSGKASTGYLMPMLLKGLFGLDVRMVTGYRGSSTTIFSVERGETQFAAYNWLAWDSKVPHWFKGDHPFARAIIQLGVFRDPDLPKSVPMVSDLVTNPLDRKAVNFIRSIGILGRGLAVPPGTPKDAIKALRMAYDRMNADPAFAAALKKRRLRLVPATGEQIQKVVVDAIDNATPDVVKHARELIFGGQS